MGQAVAARRMIVSCLVGLMLAMLAGCGSGRTTQFEPPADGEPQDVLLIGWDGVQRAHLQEMIARDEVPNLMALAAEGALVDIDVTTGATDTKAGWSQILTGYSPDITGVYGNLVYDAIPEGYTVLERLKTHFGPTGIFTAFIAGKRHNLDTEGPGRLTWDEWVAQRSANGLEPGDPIPGRRVGPGVVVEEDGAIFVDFPPRPYYYTARGVDLFVNGLGANQAVAQRAMSTLTAHRRERFFMFVQFAEPDETGHAFGENSQEYTGAISNDDAWLGVIVAKLRQLQIYDRVTVYVTSDHGFDEGRNSHRDAPYVFVATNDPVVSQAGDRADVAPTVLRRFGVEVSALAPPLTGRPLD